MSSLTKKEWDYIDKEVKAIIAALVGILKELADISSTLNILVKLKIEEKEK